MESPPDKAALERMLAATLAHYERSAGAFWEGTKDHDVTQNYAALLGALPQRRPLDILDLGCGPGRDLRYFKERGHNPVGLDGCAAFCEMARRYSGCPVLHQEFCALQLDDASFDGVFANASLFHVPRAELPRVLKELHAALRPGGVLFSSNPRGSGESFDGRRYAHYMELDDYRAFLDAAGFEVLHHYYRPAGLPRSQQPWLAVVSRK